MPSFVTLFEFTFNLVYLTSIWWLCARMARAQPRQPVAARRAARWVGAATFVLALGDTFHLAPRSLGALSALLGRPVDTSWWVGFGLLASSVTVTLFYAFLTLYVYRKFDLAFDAGFWVLAAAFVARLALLAFPQNHWFGEAAPAWRFYRNIPFTVQGAGVVLLLLRQAGRDVPQVAHALRIAAYAIVISFLCYFATLVGARWSPAWGAMMMPKTVAYVFAVAWLYRLEFAGKLYDLARSPA